MIDDVTECEFCSRDLLRGMNWWFQELAVCNDCHNQQVADPHYLRRLDALGD